MVEMLQAAGDFLWYQFVLGFCRNVPLIVIVVLMVLVICGRIGRSLGIPLLVWHEHPWKRFFSGLAITILFAEIFLVGYLFETNWRNSVVQPTGFLCRRWVPPPKSFAELFPYEFEQHGELPPLQFVPLAWYLANMTAIVLGLVVFVRLFGKFRFADAPRRYWRVPMFLFGVAGGVFIIAAMLGLFGWLSQSSWAQFAGQEMLNWSFAMPRLDPIRTQNNRALLRPDWAFHFAALCILVVHLIAFFMYRFDRRGLVITPVVSVCRVLGIGVFVYGMVMYWLWSEHLGLWLTVLFVFLIMLGGMSKYKNRFHTLPDRYYSNLVPLAEYNASPTFARPSCVSLIKDATDDASTSIVQIPSLSIKTPIRRNPPEKRPVALICASGGGSRSAVWTTLVLEQLNERIPGFSHHVRLMTGASGGMLGASYHAACLQKPQDWPYGNQRCRFADRDGPIKDRQMARRLAGDALSPVVHRMLFSDIFGIFFPFPLKRDRGEGLEIAWDYLLNNALNVPFQELAQGECEGWRPSLILSPMFIEDGRRLLVSNLDLDFLAVNDWVALDKKRHGVDVNQSRSIIEFFKLFSEATDFPLKTAVRMSASFPYISPAGVLPTKPRRRVVDAAYYDSYGVNVAAMWLHARREWLAQHASKVVLIQIRDGLDEQNRLQPEAPADKSSAFLRGWEWLLNPPHGALAARTSVMAYRNDEELELLTAVFEKQFGKDFFSTVLLENPEQISMSWYLAREEFEMLENAATDRIGRVRQRIDELAEWWA